MSNAPENPKIYHITHVNNLREIATAGCIWSDSERLRLGLACEVVGMSDIKQRRLTELEVDCHSGTRVGEYTPFYFCPRSIMLYILHMGNHPDLTYSEGQRPMVTLEADLREAVAWADQRGVRWAFSNRNAGAFCVDFWNDLSRLDQVNWEAVQATDFRPREVKEGKQAEFLMHRSFPWELVHRIGVVNESVRQGVIDALAVHDQRPEVSTQPSWYY